jgi:hypothetical protein
MEVEKENEFRTYFVPSSGLDKLVQWLCAILSEAKNARKD